MTNRVLGYDVVTRRLVVTIGGRGSEVGKFDKVAQSISHYGPGSLAVDPLGREWASDPINHRVQRFEVDGNAFV